MDRESVSVKGEEGRKKGEGEKVVEERAEEVKE